MRRQLAANAKKALANELLDDQFAFESASPALAIAVSEALDQLSERLPRAVRAFELREYGGYSYEEMLELMSAEYRTKALLAADLTLVRKSLVNILRGAP
jgi:DNA-directed RNA polymerase specialized sigma24 family protein